MEEKGKTNCKTNRPRSVIKNKPELLSHGAQESRRIVLEIAERTLRRLDSYERIKSITRLKGEILQIGTKSWDLSKKRNIYLLGA